MQNSEEQLIDIREALRQAIDEEMTLDPNVVLLGEEVAQFNGAYKISKGLLDKWGDKRIIDTPISEAGFSGIGIGAAMKGIRPIIEFMSWNFSFVAADQIISHAAKLHYMTAGRFNVPIVFRGPNGAASQVSCQHSHCVEAMYANFPGLIIIAPSCAYDAKGLLKSAIRNNNPVIFLENELEYSRVGSVPFGDYTVPIGKALVKKEGTDLTIISYSRTLNLVLEAAEIAREKYNISSEVIDLRTIKPLDVSTILASINKTHRCLIVEEGHYFCGIGSEIITTITTLAFDSLDAAPVRLCQKETPMPYNKTLEHNTLPNVDRIVTSIKQAAE